MRGIYFKRRDKIIIVYRWCSSLENLRGRFIRNNKINLIVYVEKLEF